MGPHSPWSPNTKYIHVDNVMNQFSEMGENGTTSFSINPLKPMGYEIHSYA